MSYVSIRNSKGQIKTPSNNPKSLQRKLSSLRFALYHTSSTVNMEQDSEKASLANQIQQVLNGAVDIKEVFETVGEPLSTEDYLMVFDSSFNPPHRAHRHVFNSGYMAAKKSNPAKTVVPVLMLSVNNADKGRAALDDYINRISMMKLFLAESPFPGRVLITNASRFIDKYVVMGSRKVSFVIGTDTLKRLFDPVYYGGSINEMDIELNRFDFRLNTELLVVEREEEPVANSMIPNPENWKFQILEGSALSYGVSSTHIRKSAAKNDWETVLKEVGSSTIVNYIKKSHLYDGA